jgi:hypothetical protein
MDDDQLDKELAALQPQADESKESEAKDKPEGKDEAETETTQTETDETAGDDASEEAESEDSEDEDEPKAEPKKKPSGIERLKRRLAAAEAELATARSRQSTAADVAGEVEKIIGKPPREEDFKGDYLAFERAQTVYELDKRQAEREVRGRATQQEQQALARRREAAEAHQERVEEFREKAKDFDAVLKGASDLKASPVVEDLILESDKSAHLVYYLAKNPDRLNALNGMSERQAAREIGRIESRLSLPQPKTQTKAPKPVTPPKGGATPNSPERDLDAWLKRTYGS